MNYSARICHFVWYFWNFTFRICIQTTKNIMKLYHFLMQTSENFVVFFFGRMEKLQSILNASILNFDGRFVILLHLKWKKRNGYKFVKLFPIIHISIDKKFSFDGKSILKNYFCWRKWIDEWFRFKVFRMKIHLKASYTGEETPVNLKWKQTKRKLFKKVWVSKVQELFW